MTQESLFDQARGLSAENRTDEAKKVLRQLIARNPEHWPAQWELARLVESPREKEELRGSLAHLADSPKSEEVRANALAILSILEDNAEAKDALLEKALEIDEDSSLAHTLRGALEEERGRSDRALDDYMAALEAGGAPNEAWFGLARAAIAEHRLKLAEKALVVSERLAPRDPRWSYDLGTLLLSEGKRPARAVRALERARKLQPRDVDTLLNLGAAYLACGKEQRALETLEEAGRADPDDPDTLYNLAVFYADHAGDPETAVRLFKKYLEKTDSNRLRVEKWIRELEAKVRDGG